MWHEARKQEKKIRGILVDYKRRAERRRDFYEKIKADPTQFLQLHGRPTKIHLDPAVALAADSPANMMPWQGQSDILIDRFDVRAHLDIIPNHPNEPDVPSTDELSYEDRMSNYERYRIIVQNDFLGIGEEKFLNQLYLEEQFGPTELEKKPTKMGKGAAIPFTYDEDTPPSEPQENSNTIALTTENQEEEEEDDDSDIDFDLCVDVSAVSPQQAHEMNVCANVYGMCGNDFYSFLTRDIEEKESLRLAREQEEEKAMFSGRKSRRERRAFRERRLQGRKISPPSYAARTSPTYDPYRKSESKSRSRSHSPINSGQITYITSFGGEEDEGDAEKPLAIVPEKPKPSTASRPSRKLISSETSSRYRPQNNKSNSPESSRQWRGFKSPPRPLEGFKKRHKSRSRSPESKYRRNNRSRSPDSPRYKRTNHSRSRTPSETSKYRRTNKSRSPESPRYRRNRSRSHSPMEMSKYRRINKSRSPDRRTRRSPSPRHRRNNRSRSRSSESLRHRRFNRSRSQSPDNSKNRKRTRSRSPAKLKVAVASPKKTGSPPPPPVRRYYGTRKGQSSSSELEDLSDVEMKPAINIKPQPNKSSTSDLGNSGGGSKHQTKGTARERLKKKMQTLLNRQYKADKQAERMRVKKQQQERQEREDELREIAIKLRRRERARRHQDRGDSDDESGSWRSSSSLSSYSPSRETSPGRENRVKSRRVDAHASHERDSESPSSYNRDCRLVDY